MCKAFWKINKNDQSYLGPRKQIEGTRTTPTNVQSRIKRNSGRKSYTVSDIQDQIERFHLSKRRNITSMATASGNTTDSINKSTLHRTITKGHLKRHTSVLRPLLTDGNKIQRLKNALDSLTFHPGQNQYVFNGMFDQVHVAEKWFNIMKDKQTFIWSQRNVGCMGQQKVNITLGASCFFVLSQYNNMIVIENDISMGK